MVSNTAMMLWKEPIKKPQARNGNRNQIAFKLEIVGRTQSGERIKSSYSSEPPVTLRLTVDVKYDW